MTYFKKILEKVPDAVFKPAGSRTTIWRHKTGKVKPRLLYFGIGVSFNIDGNRVNLKKNYKKVLQEVENSLDKKDIDFLVNWIDKNFYRVSKNVKINDVNSKGKLFMHLLYILPYVKYKFKENNIENISGFISRVLFNCTRSWYTNYCKKYKPHELGENR